MTCLLIERTKRIIPQIKFRYYWSIGYAIFAIIFYYFSALNTNVVGMREYHDSWWPMAILWGGFFIWPMIFLPFALYSLYRPITTVVESAAYSVICKNYSSFFVYAAPIFLAILLAVGAWLVKVKDERQVPWTLAITAAQADCSKTFSEDKTEMDDVLRGIVTYDRDDGLRRLYERLPSGVPFWLKNKCWPNILF